MDIKKIRKAVMASRGLMSSTTDTTIREIWRNLDAETQEAYLKKVKGDKDVTSINDGKVPGSSNRSRGDGKPPDVPVPVSERQAAAGGDGSSGRDGDR